MSQPHESLPTPSTGQLDPSLPDWRQAIDPDIMAAATEPGSLDPQQHGAAIQEATRLTNHGERVILSDEKGEPRWGGEINKPGDIFSFKGSIRAAMDDAPDDPVARADMGYDRFSDSYLRGDATHLIIETDDGQQLMIRRTNETRAGKNQKFDIASTSKAGRHDIDSSMLKDVVAIVGEPLVLGADPNTGKRPRTRGAITRITTIDMNKEPVAANHPRLAKPELRRDTVQQFGEAMKAASRQEAATELGEDAVKQTVEPIEGSLVKKVAQEAQEVEARPVAIPEAQVSEVVVNLYERFTNEQLEQIRENIADSLVSAIQKYDPTEVARASTNLAAIQREFQARFPELRPQYERGTEIGAVTYVTEPDPQIVRKVADQLKSIDGGYGIVSAIYGGLRLPESEGIEAKLRTIEEHVLLENIFKLIKNEVGSEFDKPNNPYASQTNEELAHLIDQFKETIVVLEGKGQDTQSYRQSLGLIGQVIKSRQAV